MQKSNYDKWVRKRRTEAISIAIPYAYSKSFTQLDIDSQLALIESGLSFFWSARLKTVHPFDVVAEHDLELKKKPDKTASFLNNTPNTLLLGNKSRLIVDAHVHVETEERIASLPKARENFENLLDRVRQIKGLEYFMQPWPFSELCRAANKGHIIVLNASGGCLRDIFVLKPQKSSVQHIQITHRGATGLDNNTIRQLCEDWAQLSRTAVKTGARDVRDVRRTKTLETDEDTQFTNFLIRLWRLIVNPILEALDLKAQYFMCSHVP